MAEVALQQRTLPVPAPAPVRGILANTPLFGSDAAPTSEAAILLYNLVPREFGCSVRKGSAEHATNIPFITDEEVRTIAEYSAPDGTRKLLAMSDSGIYDVAAGGAGAWVAEYAWPTPGGASGWASAKNFTNDAGTHYLLVCDEINGYVIYDGGTTAWRLPVGVTGPAVGDLVQAVEWQGRMWFVERDTGNAWYTDTAGAFEGAMSKLNMGNRFHKGGHLVALAVWTVDDGAGMDDKLVAISSGGDLLVWELGGTFNPASASDLRLAGRWTVGVPPAGRRSLSQWGGDVAVMSDEGIVKVSALLGGVATINADSRITNDISRYFSFEMDPKVIERGWQFEINPKDRVAIVSVPTTDTELDQRPIQFVLSTNTGAWCMYRDLDMLCMESASDDFYFGTRDGRVMKHADYADDVDLTGSTAGTITFSMLTHYSHFGMPGQWKAAQFARVNFIGQGQPTYSIEAKFDFDLTELATNPAFTGLPSSAWDSAIWDIDTWAGATASFNQLRGLAGQGRHVAIAMRGETSAETSFIGVDLMFQPGGLL